MAVRILHWFTVVVAIYHMVVVAQAPTWLGIFIPHSVHKALSVASALVLIFFLIPTAARAEGVGKDAEPVSRPVPWYDYLLLLSALVSAGFVVFFHETVLDYGLYGFMDTFGIVFSLMLAVPLLVAVYRVTGLALPIIILFFVFITLFQRFLPGLLHGRGYPLDRLLFSSYVGDAGIFGLPLGISANIVIIYLVFGALMHRSGASEWFMEIALSLTGWSRGGPAKAAVVASALFGSISGSPSGNSATTGVFTIPLMKNVGYTPAFAAGVEAVASTGGMILPPVMGAIAFLMAEWIEVSYVSVVAAAAIPAALYYLIVFISVHFQAQKDGIQALPRDQLPALIPALTRGWRFLIPVAALVYFLIFRALPPGIAGVYTSGVVIVSSFLTREREKWLLPGNLSAALEDGVKRWVTISAITAGVGIMIGALELSGVGIKISRFIVDLAGGNLPLTLLFIGVVSLIVGMGLDATPAYVTLATLMAPALVQLGVPEMGAHLFVIYWGLASFYTPPTCIAVYVTAGIAGSKIWETGWEAVRLGIAAFIIPFAFVFSPALLLVGTLGEVVIAASTAVLGATLVAGGVRGYFFGHLKSLPRLFILVAGLLFVAPGLLVPAAGMGLALLGLALRLVLERNNPTAV